MADLLEIEALSRRFGSLLAVDRIDLRISAGERHAIIGPNGAGKTTLLDLVAGATRPDSGRIRLGGRDITRLSPARRARLGVGRIHQRPAVWSSLTVLDNVLVAGWCHTGGWRTACRPARFRELMRDPATDLLDRLGLAGQADVPAGHLSHGQRRQLEIAMALAGGPRLLLLDEPAAGLSTVELHRLRSLLAELPDPVTLLLVEHRLDLVYALAGTVTVLCDGRLLATGTPDEISRSTAVRRAYAEAVP